MLYLQDLAKQEQRSQSVTVTERLPSFIAAPCVLDVLYSVEARQDYYLIHMQVKGTITSICQRCLSPFSVDYVNKTQVAACRDDVKAAELLEHYECIVTPNWQVALEDLLNDELHLYVPQFHADIKDCDSQINQILNEKNETY